MKQFQLTNMLASALLAIAGCRAPAGDVTTQQQPRAQGQTNTTGDLGETDDADSDSSSANTNNTGSNSSSNTSSQSNNNNGGGNGGGGNGGGGGGGGPPPPPPVNNWTDPLQDAQPPRLAVAPGANRVPALADTADHGLVKRYVPVANPENPLAGFRTFLQADNPAGGAIPNVGDIGNNHPTPNRVVAEAVWQGPHAAAGKKIQIVHGDITKEMGAPAQVTAIVNAANGTLNGGGGVDGAIGTAAGRNPYNELTWANGYKAQRNGGNNVPVGSAVVSNPGNLATRTVNGAQQRMTYIIHVVGPRGADANKEHLLHTAIWNALAKASTKGVQVISFPAISTGIFGYPLNEAVQIFFQTTVQYINAAVVGDGTSLRTIRFTNIDIPDGGNQATPKAFLTELRRLLVD